MDVGGGGRGPHSNNVLDFIIDHSNDSQDPQTFTRSTVLDFTGKKLTLLFIAHKFVDRHHPPPLRPLDAIHVIGVPRFNY